MKRRNFVLCLVCTLAISSTARADSAVAWGSNHRGQLGNGMTGAGSTPRPVSGMDSGVTAIAAGGWHSLAVLNGGAYAWGTNVAGQNGDGTFINRSSPVPVIGLSSGVTAVAAGGFANDYGHSLAVQNGAVLAWGDSSSGQLGNGTFGGFRSTPVPVIGMDSGVTAIAANSQRSLAIKNGGLWAWGINDIGQLGNGTNTTAPPYGISMPVAVLGMDSGVTAVAAGLNHSLAVKDGGLYAWGWNGSGALGIGTADGMPHSTPMRVIGLSSGVTAVAAGYEHSLAVAGGRVYAWGNGNGIIINTPLVVDPTHLTDIVAVAAENITSYALSSDGSLWRWSSWNQTQGSFTPVQLLAPEGYKFTSIAAGGNFALATLAAIPEPSTLLLLCLGSLAALSRRLARPASTRRRKHAQFHQQTAMFHAFGKVHAQDVDCRTTDGRESRHVRTVPREVRVPVVAAGMKERRQFARVGVVTGDVDRLERVAVETTDAQVLGCGRTMMISRADMVDGKRQRIEFFGHPAEFAQPARARQHKLAKFAVDCHDGYSGACELPRASRARACRMPSNVPTRRKPSISARSESVSNPSLLRSISSRIRSWSSRAKASDTIASAFSGDRMSRSMIADSWTALVDMCLFYRAGKTKTRAANMMRRPAKGTLPMKRLVCLFLVCLLSSNATCAHAAEIRTVALSGQHAPGLPDGGIFDRFDNIQNLVLNDAGQVAFLGNSGSSTWSEGSGSLALVVTGGMQAPGLPNGVTFSRSQYDVQGLVLNDAGQTAFGASAGSRGIWSEGTGSLTLVARGGDQAPGAPSGVNFGGGFSRPLINNAGQTAFTADLSGSGIDATNNQGIWSEGSGSLALVAREGDHAPGTPSGVNFRFQAGVPLRPVLNDAGQTAFPAFLTGEGVDATNGEGVWSEGSGTLAPVARSGSPAPGTTSGVNFRNFNFGVAEQRLALNSAGQTAFEATLSGTDVNSFNNNGIWSEGSGTLALVAREGDHAPGTPSGVIFRDSSNSSTGTLRAFEQPRINDAGQTAFLANIADSAGARIGSGIWLADDGNLTLVARTGDLAPGMPDGVNFGGVPTYDFQLNNAGQIAFAASFTGGNGIWATDRSGDLQLVARTGDQLEVVPGDFRTIAQFNFPLFGSTGNGDGRPSAFNNRGQLAFSVSFTDGTAGIFVSNRVAVPEPSTLLLLCFGSLAMLRRRR